jgi:hypothetical protein
MDWITDITIVVLAGAIIDYEDHILCRLKRDRPEFMPEVDRLILDTTEAAIRDLKVEFPPEVTSGVWLGAGNRLRYDD